MTLRFRIMVPATTANLGPGFDCLGLTLDLWNETIFSLKGSGITLDIHGEGQNVLPVDSSNLIAQTVLRHLQDLKYPAPAGLQITCKNAIPIGSGLGSSSASVVAGLLGAAAIAGLSPKTDQLLRPAAEIEGHPDNIAPALMGGLVIVISNGIDLLARRTDLPDWRVALAVPDLDFPTRVARKVLPSTVPLADAVHNLGRTALVVEALRTGDIHTLSQVMDDRLHQPYRLKMIPGAAEAILAASQPGSSIAALSGAGPSTIAFTTANPQLLTEVMVQEFARAGVKARGMVLSTTNRGAALEWIEGSLGTNAKTGRSG